MKNPVDNLLKTTYDVCINDEKEMKMFRIPSFYKEEVEFSKAWEMMTLHGRGDCLEGMKAMDRAWDEYLASENALFNGEVDEVTFADDEDFFEHYGAECNAYNVVYEGMGQLFK